MYSLYNLIMTVLEKPELYLGKQSIQRMYAYIGGFLHQNNAVDDHCLDGFNEYISAYYRITSDHNWADIIQFFANDGREEIALFKKHFDVFTVQKASDGSQKQGTVLREP